MKWIVKANDIERICNNYNEARHEMAECKKNWEEQINEMEWGEERAKMIERYWSIRIEKMQ